MSNYLVCLFLFIGMDLQAKCNGILKRRRNSAFWDFVACVLGYICLYYVKYIYKEPCMTSFKPEKNGCMNC